MNDPEPRTPADLPAAEVRILGRLLAAQNVLPVLPTAGRIAEFYADALATVPGVGAGRVCLVQAAAEVGGIDGDACAGCPVYAGCPDGAGSHGAGSDDAGSHDAGPGSGGASRPRSAWALSQACQLASRPDVHVIPLRTMAAGYGFFVLRIGDRKAFRRYAPFVANLGSFLALWLENRRQHDDLLHARNALERRVDERTAELRAANVRLEAEIEERKRAESMVRRLNEELELRVRDRTAQLEAANWELEGFAYSVSHDLRAPLRHINGFAEALREQTAGQLGEEEAHYLEAISTCAGRMDHLIGDLLSFSRMGRAELSVRPVDLTALVRDVIGEFTPETGGRSVRWVVEGLPVVRGDAAMLRVVLVNLMSNALKFTRPRQVAEIRIGSMPGSGPQVVIYVQDNGIGFDPADAERVFGVFERLPGAAAFEGTGIGLASVRRIALRHGGRAWAEGVPGQGATFFFSLPPGGPACPEGGSGLRREPREGSPAGRRDRAVPASAGQAEQGRPCAEGEQSHP